MARPLRIEYPGAYYHVMNRGQSRRNIFMEDKGRQSFLDLLADIARLWKVEIFAYCSMDNHYHLLLSTPTGELSRPMRHLNGIYTQKFNRVHHRDGPLFRGRYKAILIDAEEYFLSVVRYIHKNPPRRRSGIGHRPVPLEQPLEVFEQETMPRLARYALSHVTVR